MCDAEGMEELDARGQLTKHLAGLRLLQAVVRLGHPVVVKVAVRVIVHDNVFPYRPSTRCLGTSPSSENRTFNERKWGWYMFEESFTYEQIIFTKGYTAECR